MKKADFKCYSHAFCFTLFVLVCLIILPHNVQAADKYQIINVTEKSRKVGNVRFSSSYTNGGWNVYFQKKNGKKELIENQDISTVLMTNGKKVYYYSLEVNGYPYTARTYEMNLSTGKVRQICSVSGIDEFELAGIDSKNLYYIKNLDPGSLCAYNFKSKTHKKLLDNVTSAAQYGNVFLCTPYWGGGGSVELQMYNTKTGIGKQISNGMVDYRVIKNKIYYVECIKENDFNDYVCNVILCDMNGKNKKILLKNKRIAGIIEKITSSYITYQDYMTNKTYTYRFSNQ